MSAVPLKRSLRPKQIINYHSIARGKGTPRGKRTSRGEETDTSILSDRNISVISDQNFSLLSDQNDSLLSDPNFSVVTDTNGSCEETNNDSSGDELFSEEKKLKLADDLHDTSHMRRASITLKRVAVPRASTPLRTLDKNVDLAEILAATEEDEDENANEYRLQRQKQMLDREMMLKSIDFHDDVQELKVLAKPDPVVQPVRKRPPPVKRTLVKRLIVESRRRSERLQNRSIDQSFESFYNILDSNGRVSHRRRSDRLGKQRRAGRDFGNYLENEDSQLGIADETNGVYTIDEKLNFPESGEDQEFLSSLKDTINVTYDSVSDFTSCDFNKFKETILLCRMFEEPAKIITSRIVSMDFHPSEKKLLILVGDKYGNIALRDLVTYNGVEIKGHQYNTNCLKFSKQNSAKFYSASLDGTVRIGDINTSSLNLLYTSDYHTTWHHESGNTLYISEGSGAVRLLDLRSPNINPPSFQCFKRSVRTVQTHPLDENYFLTSCGLGYFRVWDVRYIKAVDPTPTITKSYNNGLTSAFYSAKGKYVLTTGNDDTIRVYEIENDAAREITRISHNNHTGRWLSVFKAIWQPQREDCFYVGSMLNPRRMQAYTHTGAPVREFQSDALCTVNSVITVHPTKPIIVGGNGSGKIHIFSPFSDLKDI